MVYEIARYDTLFYDPGLGGNTQASHKTGLLLIRPPAGRENEPLEVVLQSLAAGAGTVLAVSSLDSAAGSRWQVTLGPSGPAGGTIGEPRSILAEQMWVVGGLLLPQLPQNGVRPGDSWSDSTTYRLKVDAFDATESAVRTSRAGPAEGGVMVEATEQLRRSGNTSQGGQSMSLSGAGTRWLTYSFTLPGVVASLSARDSLDLRVRVEATGQLIPVRYRAALTARLRGVPPR